MGVHKNNNKVMAGVEQYPWDVNVLKCCCGPHNGPVMKFTIDTKGVSLEDTERVTERLKESMYRKPMINPVTGEIEHKYTPQNITRNLFIPIEGGNKNELVGSCSLVGNMQAPSDFSDEAKEDYYRQLKSMYGDNFDEETKQLRIDNMKVNPNTGGIYSTSSRYSVEIDNRNKGLFKKFLSKFF